jgi:hypothetical protein
VEPLGGQKQDGRLAAAQSIKIRKVPHQRMDRRRDPFGSSIR